MPREKRSIKERKILDAFNKELGRRILKERMKLGKSRPSLSDISGLTEQYIYLVEKGSLSMSAYNLSTLARSLNIATSDLLPPIPHGKKSKARG